LVEVVQHHLRDGVTLDLDDDAQADTVAALVLDIGDAGELAVAKVVLNNLYKHTQLQTSFGANMLSIVDGVPRTLRIDQLIR
ncbi:hypothetical protein C6A85_13865, partial [Mycobacterium sp. ITM-2017-0098]